MVLRGREQGLGRVWPVEQKRPGPRPYKGSGEGEPAWRRGHRAVSRSDMAAVARRAGGGLWRGLGEGGGAGGPTGLRPNSVQRKNK